MFPGLWLIFVFFYWCLYIWRDSHQCTSLQIGFDRESLSWSDQARDSGLKEVKPWGLPANALNSQFQQFPYNRTIFLKGPSLPLRSIRIQRTLSGFKKMFSLHWFGDVTIHPHKPYWARKGQETKSKSEMDLEISMLNEMSLTERGDYCKISLLRWI